MAFLFSFGAPRYLMLWFNVMLQPDVAVNETAQQQSRRFGPGSFQTRSQGLSARCPASHYDTHGVSAR
jgi:hypothetical protein